MLTQIRQDFLYAAMWPIFQGVSQILDPTKIGPEEWLDYAVEYVYVLVMNCASVDSVGIEMLGTVAPSVERFIR